MNIRKLRAQKFYYIGPWCQYYKAFFFVTDILNKNIRVLVSVEHLQPILTFVSKTEQPTDVAHLSGLKPNAFHTNIRQG
jgi:hypothetical protein